MKNGLSKALLYLGMDTRNSSV